MSDFLGPAIASDGSVRFFSPTSLSMGDPRAGGCGLKFFYRYVRRIKPPDTGSMDEGRKLHDELARYQKTGARDLSALAMSGLHMVPTGPDLFVEVPIHNLAQSPTITSLLYADGVPVVGWVDHVNRRGVNMGAEDILDTQDPPGTVEIIDWKWKRDGSKSQYFLSPDQLITDTQLCGYGLGIGRYFGASHVRLGHGYFPSMRGRPRKVTKLHVIQDCADNWKYVDGLARHLRGIARESNPERIEGNRNACESYGGCPYRDQCPTYKQASSADIFGVSASKDLSMALQFGQQPAAPAATAQQLADEEAKLRAQVAQQQVMPGFAEAVARLHAQGQMPKLAGAAAQMYAAAGGQSVPPGYEFPGVGMLANMPAPITDPQHVLQLVGQVAPAPAPVTPPAAPWGITPPWSPQAVQHILPPDAPQSQPHLAAKPVEGFPMPAAPTVTNTTVTAFPGMTTTAAPQMQTFTFPPAQQPQGPTGGSPPVTAAPVSPPPSSAGATASPATSAPIPEAAAAPKKRGPKPKSPTPVVTDADVARAKADAIALGLSSESHGYKVFVDCTPNIDAESLHPYVDGIVAELVSRFCAPPALPDLRCAPKDGPLGFGGWRGALRAIVLEKPPAAGTYYLNVAGDEIAAEVAAAMLTVCNKTGGLYVR